MKIDLSNFVSDYSDKVKQLLRFLSVGLLVFGPLMMARPAYAASASLSLSPASSSVNQGATFTITVRMTSDEPVNGVQANLSYPADLLDFVSIGTSSAFSIVAENAGGGGSVRIGRGALPAVSGSQSVATVRFKARTSSGSAAVNFAGGSQVVSANSNANIMTGSSGGNYTLRPTATPAPASPAAAADTIPPTISSVKTSDAKTNSVTVSWTTSEPATSEVVYGLNTGYGISATDGNRVTEHRVVLNSPLLVPGKKYHFIVKSVDAAGNAASSQDSTFTTQGATLQVKVVNQDNKPVSGAKVTFGDVSGTTDKNGQAMIAGLALGKQTGVVEHSGDKTTVTVDVQPIDPSGKLQAATFKIETKNPMWALLIPLLLLVALAVFLLKRNSGGRWGGGLGASFAKLRPGRAKTDTPTKAAIQPEPPSD